MKALGFQFDDNNLDGVNELVIANDNPLTYDLKPKRDQTVAEKAEVSSTFSTSEATVDNERETQPKPSPAKKNKKQKFAAAVVSSQYLLQSRTTIHTIPSTLAIALLNPNHEIRKNFGLDKRRKGNQIPDAKIVLGELGDDKIFFKSYRKGITSKLLYEFFHMYVTIKLKTDNILIAFCTIDPKELPLEEGEATEFKETDTSKDDLNIVPGWKEMGNYQIQTAKYDQSVVSLNFLIDVNPSRLSPGLLLSDLKNNAEILESARVPYLREMMRSTRWLEIASCKDLVAQQRTHSLLVKMHCLLSVWPTLINHSLEFQEK